MEKVLAMVHALLKNLGCHIHIQRIKRGFIMIYGVEHLGKKIIINFDLI